MFFTNILKYSHVSFKQRDNYRFAEIFSQLKNDMQSVLETFARFIYRINRVGYFWSKEFLLSKTPLKILFRSHGCIIQNTYWTHGLAFLSSFKFPTKVTLLFFKKILFQSPSKVINRSGKLDVLEDCKHAGSSWV